MAEIVGTCPIHNTDLFQGKYGPVHKLENGTWCNGQEKDKKPSGGHWEAQKKSFEHSLASEKPDWDKLEKQIIKKP